MFVSVDLAISGLVATLRSPRTTLRFGLHEGRTSRKSEGTPVDYPFVPIAPGLGYYRMNAQLPGPPIELVSRIRNQVITLGADHRFGDGWRLTAELARNQQFRTRLGSNTLGGYAALAKDIGTFTPYVSVGRLTTSRTQMDRYRRLTGNLLPPVVPGAAQINAAQRIGAESIYAADQTTWALGTAWRTPLGGTLKLEHGSVHIGEVSRLIDAPPGQPTPQNRRFGTWTLSYSVAY